MVKSAFTLLFFIFLAQHVHSQNHLWSFSLGSSGDDFGRHIFTDNKGFLYVVGYFNGTNVDFDPAPTSTAYLSSNGAKDGYVAKYTVSGQYLWAFSIGGSNLDEVNGVTVDNSGNVFITGYFRGPNVDFDPSPGGTALLTSNGDQGGDPGYGGDIFLAKYTSAGNYLWAFNVGASSLGDNALDISSDNAGNVAISGYFRGSPDFDPSPVSSSTLDASTGTLFVAKYNNNGGYLWAFNAGIGNDDNSSFGMKIDAAGNIYLTGFFQGTGRDFDPSPTGTAYLSSNGGFDIFVAKYTSSGNYAWAFGIGGPNIDVGRDIEIDDAGNVYVAGDFEGNNIDFDPSPTGTANLTSNNRDVFLAKYNNAGQYQWAKRFGDVGSDISWSLAFTKSNLYITGSFQGTMDFNPGPVADNLVSNGANDFYLTKFDVNGNYVCAFSVGGAGNDDAYKIDADTSGNLYVTGILSSSNTDFNPGAGTNNLSTNGAADIFVAKYIWPDNPKPSGTLSGSTICPGQQATLTFTATAGTGPFTIEYSNGTATYTQSNVQSGVPFNLSPNPVATTTYILISIRDATVCPSTNNVAGITAVVMVGSCNPASFTTSVDTVCINAPVNIVNTSGVASSYYWSFCTADVNVPPTSTLLLSGLLNVPVYMDYAYDNGNYYGFVTNNVGSNLLRLDFGNSLLNYPTYTNLGNMGGIIPGSTEGVQVVKNQGNWYAIIVGGSNGNSRIVKINLGTNIANNSPSGTNWGNLGNLAYPHHLHVFEDNGNWYGLTVNALNNTITRFNFTNDFSNFPTGQNLGNLGNLSYPTGIFATKNQSNNWCVFITNRQSSTLTRLDFGNSLMNIPTGVNLGNLNGLFDGCSGIQIMNYCDGVYGFIINANNNHLIEINFNGNVLNTPVGSDFGNNYGLSFSHCFSRIFRNGSDLYSFTPNVNSNNITRFKFNGCTNASISSSILQNPPPISYNSPGIYNITFVTNEGLSTQSSFCKQIVVLPPPTINGIGDTAVCSGTPVQLDATGGNVYSWTPAGSLSNGNIHNPVATTDTTVKYVVTGYLQPGCTGHDTVKITILPRPFIMLIPNNTACAGDSFHLSATGGGAYSWSPSTGLSATNIGNPVSTATSGIKYYVTVTSAQGCSSIDSITVSRVQKPVVTTRGDTALCSGGGVVLTTSATNNPTISWSPPTGLSNPTILNPVASPNDTTRYIVTAANGSCIARDTVTINVKPKPVVTLNNDTSFCKGISLSLNATGGGTYQWSPGTGLSNNTVSNPVATPDTTTKYFVTVTSANGCAGTDSVKITIYQKPTVQSINDTSVCKNIAVNLSTTVTNANSISWSPATGLSNPNINSPVASPNDTTRYIVTAVNGTCTTKDTVTISIKPKPVVTLNNDTSFCKGISLSLNATGGGTYQWSPGTGLSNNMVSNPVATPDTTTKYFVTVTSANGCAGTDSVKITIYQKPTVQSINDTSVCKNIAVNLNTTVTNASSVSWFPAIGLSNPNINSPVASPNDTTRYIVTAVNGTCTTKDTVTISIKPKPVVNLNNDTSFCKGISLSLNATGGGTYQWSPGTGLSNNTVSNPVATPDTTTKYFVTVTGSNGCTGTDSVKITVYSKPVVQTIKDTSVCLGTPRVLTTSATPGVTYLWSPGRWLNDSTIASPSANPVVNTQYVVTVTTAKNCTAKDTVNLFPVNPPVVTKSPDDTICKGAVINLSAGGGTSYVWTPVTGLSNSNISNPVSSIDTSITYYVQVTGSNGCTTKDSVKVTVKPPSRPFSVDPPFTSLCGSDTLLLTAAGGDFYNWIAGSNIFSPDSASTYVVPSGAGLQVYKVKITDTVCHISSILTSTVKLNAGPLVSVNKSNDIDCKFPNVQLQATGGLIYRWQPADGLSDPNIANPVASPTGTTNYTIIVTDTSGCSTAQSIKVVVNYGANKHTYDVPDAFTPNQDGLNDCFGLKSWGNVSRLELSVYNRWGERVFFTNNTTDCWDGKFKGVEQSTAAFVYVIKATTACGGDISKKGTILLIR